MNSDFSHQDSSLAELDRLRSISEDVLRRCRAEGASEAEVSASVDLGLSVSARLGEVETVERTRDRAVAVTLWFGKRKGSASTADLHPDSIAKTVEHACAIARHTEEDPANGLADPALLARDPPELDLWHPWDVTPTEAIELAVRMERAGREIDRRIENSDGAMVQVGASLGVQANTLGFVGAERSTGHSLSLSLIAVDGGGMQRDYWYDSARAASDLADVESIGRRAAERCLARLGARRLATRDCPVLFAPEAARSLIGHFVGAVSGGALYRKASFLCERLGTRVFPSWFQLREHPHLPRGLGSAAWDAEGVATRDSDLIVDGVLQRYVLGSYAARRLGLTTTGNAGGISNLVVEPGADDFDALVRRMGRGLVVSELMGQGVSLVTGDYSRGVSGFWVENGEIAYPVEEITIAGNLAEMFDRIVAVGSDVDLRSSLRTGSILVEHMKLAGEG